MKYEAVIDLDDVLIDLHSAFIAYADEVLGIKMNVSNHTNFGFYKAYGISDQKFLDIIQEDDCFNRFKAFDTSKKSLLRLKSQGLNNNIVTARGYMDDGYHRTRKQIEMFDLPFDNLVIVPGGKTKSDCYKSFEGKIKFLADDASHNIQDAIQSGIVENIYLINKPWNKEFAGHSKVKRSTSLFDAVVSYERSLTNEYSI
jgi:5'(3')-deoxyribonucleotidase